MTTTARHLSTFTFRLAATAAAALLMIAAATGAAHAASGKHASKALAYPRRFVLTDSVVGHWAVIVKPVAAHRQPNASSPVVTKLETTTGDGTQNVVLILGGVALTHRTTWYKVRLAILPNNSTGWVPRSALGDLYIVHTHLYIDREAHVATLKRDGSTIFTTRIGNGLSPNVTPAGQYYIRDKLTGFDDPAYGPLAFGTSARSPSLIDSWPGGAYIGIHGTNQPYLIPGYISHGCIRLQNDAILKLAKLMPVGTPVTIS